MTPRLSIGLRDIAKLVIGLGVTLALCYFLYGSLDWAQIKHAFFAADKVLLGGAVAAMLLSYLLRGFRWAFILHLVDAPGSLLVDTARQLVGNMLNNLLPFRLGDVYRITAGRSGGRSLLRAGLALVLEKLVDVVLVLALGALALTLGPSEMRERLVPSYFLDLAISAPVLLGVVVAISVFIALTFLYRVSLGYAFSFVLGKLGLTTIEHPFSRLTALIGFLGLCAWLFEAFAYAFALSAFDVSAPLAVSFLLTTGIALSTILPSSPGYIGIYHYTVILIVGPWASIINPADLSVVLHAVIWGSINLFGVVAAIALQASSIMRAKVPEV